jgi:hypothetical protein
MITDRKRAAQKAAATKAAKKQAATERAIARNDAYDEKLTNTARQYLYDSVQEIKSEYETTISAALDEAETAASESLRNLAGEFGWSLVQAASEDDCIMLDNSVAQTLLDMVWFDEEEEFEELEACVESANTLYPDPETQAV